MGSDSYADGGIRRLQITAPAKVNLGLRIVGRRPDGTHELESLFVPIDLADRLEVDVQADDRPGATLAVTSEAGVPEGAVPEDGSNLALRAAHAFLAASRVPMRVDVRLSKRIPAAAGLGGGSSDAGAVLRALAGAFPNALAPGDLARLALDLGADVPFFLDPRPAWVTGIGERIAPLALWRELALVLANPGVPLSTAEVFRASDALGATPARASDPGDLARDASPERPESLVPLLRNDLEAAAVRLCPPIGRLRERLRRVGAAGVGMTGSGPTVFGVFRGVAEARSALARAGFEAPVWARVAVTAKAG
jgi:4-diphosphocytidyl-2-C-methyl-D-erythritol kinase